MTFKWNSHVEYVIFKAAKSLYALRLLKRAEVMPEDMLKLKVYTCNIRSVSGVCCVIVAGYSCVPFWRYWIYTKKSFKNNISKL